MLCLEVKAFFEFGVQAFSELLVKVGLFLLIRVDLRKHVLKFNN